MEVAAAAAVFAFPEPISSKREIRERASVRESVREGIRIDSTHTHKHTSGKACPV